MVGSNEESRVTHSAQVTVAVHFSGMNACVTPSHYFSTIQLTEPFIFKPKEVRFPKLEEVCFNGLT